MTLIDDAERPLIFYVKENGARFKRRAHRQAHAARLPGVRRRPARRLRGADLRHDRRGDEAPTWAIPRRTRAPKSGDVVGHSGIERAYDRWLRGRDGTLNVTVDAQGNPQGRATLVPAPVPGRDVRLTIDLDLQHAAEKALRKGIAIGSRVGAARRARRCRRPPAAR